MKTLLLIILILGCLACEKENEIKDTHFVSYIISTSRPGINFSFTDKNGETVNRTVTTDHWDTTFVNVSAKMLTFHAKALSSQNSWIGGGIMYNRNPVINGEAYNEINFEYTLK